MLNFFPAIYPWSYLYTDMKNWLPIGTFYLYTTHLLPRSIKPNEFWLVTDQLDTVEISINGKVVGRVNPRSRVSKVFLSLYEPPATNSIRIANGVDASVNLRVVITHAAKELEVISRELYTYAGRMVEKYSDLITSPWASFIADYQLPWRQYLPNLRSLRIMSVKMIANTLFGTGGFDGEVKDFVSAFTSTTPVVMEPKNPQLWQPDVYQPISSGYDVAGFDFHVWTPNSCLAKWAAFLKLRNNVKSFDIMKFTEDVVVVAPAGTTYYEQHITDNLISGCSVYDELISLGCMDNIVCVGVLNFKSQPTICAYAEPFDRVVEVPGIGGRFFDSGPDFDTPVFFDDIYDIDILTDFWLWTPLVKRFDFGKCLDSYPTTCLLPDDTACCTDAPDTVLMTTQDCITEVTSPVTPHNPLFGGDAPGLLENPYFDILA